MAEQDRPRNTVEALIDVPVIKDDSGGHGFGPTLGSPAPDDSEAAAAQSEPKAWPSDDDEPDLFPDAPRSRTPRRPLGSEIARAGEDLGRDALHGAEPPGEDELPPSGRVGQARPGVAAPDEVAPPPGGWSPRGRGGGRGGR